MVLKLWIKGGVHDPPPRRVFLAFNAGKDDVSSLLSVICEMLQQTQTVSLGVKGFDESGWGTRADTDLCRVLEQLPGLYQWARDLDTTSPTRATDAYAFSLYQRDTLRSLIFRRHHRLIAVEARSALPDMFPWEPARPFELLSRNELCEQLEFLVTRFLTLARRVSPTGARHPRLLAHFAPLMEEHEDQAMTGSHGF